MRAGSTVNLFDCGRGVVMRLVGGGRRRRRAFGRGAHPHALRPHHRPQRRDHQPLGDVASPTPLDVYGPKGASALVEATLNMLSFDISYRHRPPRRPERPAEVAVTELEPGDTSISATAHSPPHAHRPLAGPPTLGYRVDTAGDVAAPGRRHRRRARAWTPCAGTPTSMCRR